VLRPCVSACAPRGRLPSASAAIADPA
jgi:hypothetical protein